MRRDPALLAAITCQENDDAIGFRKLVGPKDEGLCRVEWHYAPLILSCLLARRSRKTPDGCRGGGPRPARMLRKPAPSGLEIVDEQGGEAKERRKPHHIRECRDEDG